MNEKTNIAILIGGKSSEHEVSIDSGISIINAFDTEKYRIKPVLIEKNGQWLIVDNFLESETIPIDHGYIQRHRDDAVCFSTHSALDELRQEGVDVVFIALHGRHGEDGSIQGCLDYAGFPYVGSNVAASALAMDKIRSSRLFSFHGLTVPRFISFTKSIWNNRHEDIMKQMKHQCDPPYVIKPSNDGSSVAITITGHMNEIDKAVEKALEISDQIMIQQFIHGDEVTCGILDIDSMPKAFPPTHIIPKTSKFFDYEAKYTKGASEEITPPILPQPIIDQIKDTALKAHTILGCSGLSRTDMIVHKNRCYVLETNTIPGFTDTSLYPQAAVVSGMSMSELVDKLAQNARVK